MKVIQNNKVRNLYAASESNGCALVGEGDPEQQGSKPADLVGRDGVGVGVGEGDPEQQGSKPGAGRRAGHERTGSVKVIQNNKVRNPRLNGYFAAYRAGR